jgi:hypothetical protein
MNFIRLCPNKGLHSGSLHFSSLSWKYYTRLEKVENEKRYGIYYGYKKYCYTDFCGLYYKPIMIVNDDSSIVNKLDTSPIDNARIVIYNRHVFIVQATGVSNVKNTPGY